MSTGLKRISFPLKMFFPVIALVIIVTLIYESFYKASNEAAASVAVLHSSTCLGGWKNPDLATGVPQVRSDSDVAYSTDNSATLTNTMTQLFCAGFVGEVPKDADRTKISVRFSWQMEGHQTFQKERIDSDVPDYQTEVITVTGSATTSSSTTDTVSTTTESAVDEESASIDASSLIESTEEASPEVEESVMEESVSEPTPEIISWWQWLMPFAYAQEAEEEGTTLAEISESVAELPTEEPVIESEIVSDDHAATSTALVLPTNYASSTELTATTSAAASSSVSYTYLSPIFDQDKNKDDALFEVLFTINNSEWHSLGYVSRINNDISFDLPVDLFPTVEDFSKLQISLESVERLDDVPTIYLDSMWVEVLYVAGGEDPLTPPGSLPGDVITNTYSQEDRQLVTVFRNISLEMISNILSLTASSSTATSTATTTSSSTAAIEARTATTSPTIATSSVTTTTGIYNAPISLETKNIMRETPGVLVELWLHNLTEDTWMRVADNSIVGTLPRAVLIGNRVFWFGPYNSSLWMFDSLAQGYSSHSISPNEQVTIGYTTDAGEQSTVWFNPETEQLEVLSSSE